MRVFDLSKYICERYWSRYGLRLYLSWTCECHGQEAIDDFVTGKDGRIYLCHKEWTTEKEVK